MSSTEIFWLLSYAQALLATLWCRVCTELSKTSVQALTIHSLSATEAALVDRLSRLQQSLADLNYDQGGLYW